MPTPEGHAMTSNKIWTLAEVAEVTRMSAATLRYWRNKGTGPRSFTVGGKVVYRADDVLAWIDEQYEAEQPAERGGTATWTTAKDAACR